MGYSMMRGFSRENIRLLSSLSVLEVFRMLGIFLVLPVFSIYASNFTSSGILIGIGLGAYGIAMAIFQIPMGRLSDRFGRKPVIILAMIPFIAGNLISWHPFSIYGLIIGRFVAGSGAITSSSMALAQESVPENKRTAAMAFLGIPIGLAFILGIILGPLIGQYLGYSTIFLISAVTGIAGIVPFIMIHIDQPRRNTHYMRGKIGLDSILMGFAGMITSLILISIFYFLPLYYDSAFRSGYEIVLLIPLIIGGVIAIALSPMAERHRRVLFSLISSVLIIVSIPLLFLAPETFTPKYYLIFGLIIFFSGYSLIEIVFTPILSGRIPVSDYGLNMGIYSTMQFAGQFIGGSLSGYIVGLIFTRSVLTRSMILLEVLAFIELAILIYVGYRAKFFSDRSRNDPMARQ